MRSDYGDGGVVVDVLVIMQPEFQQSFLFIFLKVPQFQFMIGHSSCTQRRVRTVQNCAGSGHARRRQWQWQVHDCFCLLCISRCVRFVCQQARDVRHHGWYVDLGRRDSTGAVLGLVVVATVVLQRQVHGLGRAMFGSTVVTCLHQF